MPSVKTKKKTDSKKAKTEDSNCSDSTCGECAGCKGNDSPPLSEDSVIGEPNGIVEVVEKLGEPPAKIDAAESEPLVEDDTTPKKSRGLKKRPAPLKRNHCRSSDKFEVKAHRLTEILENYTDISHGLSHLLNSYLARLREADQI